MERSFWETVSGFLQKLCSSWLKGWSAEQAVGEAQMLLEWIYGWIPEGSALHDVVLSYFNPPLPLLMPLVSFPEWLSHFYELTAEKDSAWEGSRTPESEP